MVNIPTDLIKIEYSRLKERLKQSEETKQYVESIRLQAKMEEIQFLLYGLQGDKEVVELLNELIKVD